MFAVVDLGDEVLVAREDDDDEERAGERQIDEGQEPEDDLRFRRRERGLGDVHQLEHELDEQHEQRQSQPEIEWRQQPAAGEDRRFHQLLDLSWDVAQHADDPLIVHVSRVYDMRGEGFASKWARS